MKDMIIKGTGNSRYLKSSAPANITYAEFLAALRAGTLPVDFNGLNETGIEQQGTPLNAATLLKNSTAAKFGFDTGEDPTVDDAFNGLALVTGAAAPATSTAGKLGQCYWDSTNKSLYKCTEINNGEYRWELISTGTKYVKKLVTEIITQTTAWTAPASLLGAVNVRIFGGGGAGGRYTNTSTSLKNAAGGGGAGGEMASGAADIAPGGTVHITIGDGGTGGSEQGNGGASSFGAYFTANGGSAGNYDGGSGGSGGGGGMSASAPSMGGGGTYGGGGGGARFDDKGSDGGDGGTYGGGGGGGYGGGDGGAGGTHGGAGGTPRGSLVSAAVPPENGTDTTTLGLEFTGQGLAGTGDHSNGGGGGYGGNGGSGGSGGGGGGGYGAAGGDCTEDGTYAGGGGGGGYGAAGGDGGEYGGGGGGGYGTTGKGGNGAQSSSGALGNYIQAESGTGYASGGGGGQYKSGHSTWTGGGNGAPGVCILTYYMFVLEGSK